MSETAHRCRTWQILRKHYAAGLGQSSYATEGVMSTLQRDPRDRVQVLDEDGRVVDGAAVPDLDEDELVEKIGRAHV